jgi:molybdenum cofactor cytidylyltransferase
MAGVFLCPVDHPRIAGALPGQMAAALAPGGIVVPVWSGRRGHPVLFARELFPELLAAPLAAGARHVVWADPGRVLEVPSDPGVLTDVDTPADYRELAGD